MMGDNAILMQKRDTTPVLDRVPGAAFAYSFRKLSAGYNGFAARITNESTLEEMDLNTVVQSHQFDDRKSQIISFAPGVVARCNTWYDQSSNAPDLVQTQVGSQFIVKHSDDSFYFDSERRHIILGNSCNDGRFLMTSGGFPDLRNGGTLFIVNHVVGTSCRNFFRMNGVTVASGLEFQGQPNVPVAVQTTDGSVQVAIERVSVLTQHSVIGVRVIDIDTLEIASNGKKDPNHSGQSPETSLNTTQNFHMGRVTNVCPYVRVSEIIGYNRVLTDEEFKIVINNMRVFYGCY